MTTLTAYSGAADGYIQSSNATYATARSGGTLTASDNDWIQAGQVSAYNVLEGFVNWDTSSIGSDDISSATLSMYLLTDLSTTDFVANCRLYDWGAAVTTGDWVAGSILSFWILLATFSTDEATASTYNAFTESGTSLRSNINKSGTTSVLFCSKETEDNSANTTDERQLWSSANVAGTTQDPKLVVVHAPPAPTATGAITLPGLAVAGTGVQVYSATAAITLPVPTVAGTGIEQPSGTGAISLPVLTVAASGAMPALGSGAITLPVLSVAGTGVMHPAGTGALALPVPAVAGDAVQSYPGTGAISLPLLSVAGIGEQGLSGSSAISLPLLSVAGIGEQGYSGSSAISLPVLSVAAVGAIPLSATGAWSLPTLTLAGTGMKEPWFRGLRSSARFYKPTPGTGRFYRPGPGTGRFYRPGPGTGR